MFQQIERPMSFVSWILQSFLAYWGPLVLLAVATAGLNVNDNTAWQIFDYIILASISFTIALILSAWLPDTADEGRWVSVIPVGVEMLVLLATVLEGRDHAVQMFYIKPRTDGRGIELAARAPHLAYMELLLVFGCHVVASSAKT